RPGAAGEEGTEQVTLGRRGPVSGRRCPWCPSGNANCTSRARSRKTLCDPEKEDPMLNALHSTERRNPIPSPLLGRKGEGQRFHRHWFDRIAMGFWLGGVGLGMGGCILGACMPYHHPVAVAISVLWWGIYLGCLGASIGALWGLMTERH